MDLVLHLAVTTTPTYGIIMSKAKKTQSVERRQRMKRQRRDAKNAEYQALTEAGRNIKRVRNQSKQSKRTKVRVRDPNSRNTGDPTLFPELNLPFLAKMLKLRRQGVRGQWTSKYGRLVSDYIEAQNK